MPAPANRELGSTPARRTPLGTATSDDGEGRDTAPHLGDDPKAANGEILPEPEAGPDGFPAQRP